MLELVGIDPGKVPSDASHNRARQIEVLLRFIGYRCGLEALKNNVDVVEVDGDISRALGSFIEMTMTFPRPGAKSVTQAMNRQLALVEGATGYPMTTERHERRAMMYFLKGVMDGVRALKLDRAPDVVPTAVAAEPAAMRMS